MCPDFSLVVDLMDGMKGATEVSAHSELDFVSRVPNLHSGPEYFTLTDHAVLGHRAFGLLDARGMIGTQPCCTNMPDRGKFSAQPPPSSSVHSKDETNPIKLKFRTATGSGTTFHCA